MATRNVSKEPCCKCDRGGMSKCDGCHQSFCRTHINEHLQELSTQMDDICQEYNTFQRNLSEEVQEHPLISRIDRWEKESHDKIAQVAKQARIELKELIEQNNKDLKVSVEEVNNQLQSSQQNEYYKEPDLEAWTNQLNEFRNQLKTPLAIDVIDDDGEDAIIRLIKVSRSLEDNPQSIDTFDQQNERTTEAFDQIGQKCSLSENGLLARCLDGNRSIVFGIQSYSNGMHFIRFRIEQLAEPKIFFGITTGDKLVTEPSPRSPSTNGWRNFDSSIENGTPQPQNSTTTATIETGDEVTLVLACDQEQIYFQHHRTQTTVQMSINLEKCPFPWKMFVALMNKNDSVFLLNDETSS